MKKIFTFIVGIMVLANFVFFVPKIYSQCGNNDWETFIQKNFYKRNMLFDLYGKLASFIIPDEIIRDGSQVIRLGDGRIVIPQESCSITYQAESIIGLSKHCEALDIGFMYVNLPSQCGSDENLYKEGVYSYCDANADNLLSILKVEGIVYLDLREKISAEAIGEKNFYFTDHHWTARAGLKAAKEILTYCNELYGSNFDVTVLEDNLFNFIEYKDCWLGETGRYASKGWTRRLDSFTLIEPKYKTNMRYIVPDHYVDNWGGFSECFIDKTVYQDSSDYYNLKSWHYSYLFANYDYAELINEDNLEGKNILLIKDSFSLVMAPYMSLPAKEIAMWDIRYNANSIFDFLEDNHFDFVIVAYTQGSSIGKPAMFDFDRQAKVD